MAPPFDIEDAVHVIPGFSPGGTLLAARGRETVILHDSLRMGPCHANPDRHQALRAGFWQEYLEGARLRLPPSVKGGGVLGAADLVARLADYPPDRPVVLWTAAAWQDRLALWWVLDAIGRTPLGRDRFCVAEPRWARGHAGLPGELDLSLGKYMPREFRQAFAEASPLRAATIRAGGVLWRQYAAASPLAFDRSRRRGSDAFPDLGRVGEVWGRAFPWAVGPRLRLSDLDRVLLGGLRLDRWLSFGGLLGNLHHRQVEFLLAREPDGGLFRRLRDWAGHDPADPAVLAEPGPGGKFKTYTAVFRLTAKAARLLQEGLDSPSEAPPLWVGGCRANDEATTWVRRGGEQDWWVERWGG